MHSTFFIPTCAVLSQLMADILRATSRGSELHTFIVSVAAGDARQGKVLQGEHAESARPAQYDL